MIASRSPSFLNRILLWVLVSVIAAAMSLQFATARPTSQPASPEPSVANAVTTDRTPAEDPGPVLGAAEGVFVPTLRRPLGEAVGRPLPVMLALAPVDGGGVTTTVGRVSLSRPPGLSLAAPPLRNSLLRFSRGGTLSVGARVQSAPESPRVTGAGASAPASKGVILFSVGL